MKLDRKNYWNVIRDREKTEGIVEIRDTIAGDYFYYVKVKDKDSINQVINIIKQLLFIPDAAREEALTFLENLKKEL